MKAIFLILLFQAGAIAVFGQQTVTTGAQSVSIRIIRAALITVENTQVRVRSAQNWLITAQNGFERSAYFPQPTGEITISPNRFSRPFRYYMYTISEI